MQSFSQGANRVVFGPSVELGVMIVGLYGGAGLCAVLAGSSASVVLAVCSVAFACGVHQFRLHALRRARWAIGALELPGDGAARLLFSQGARAPVTVVLNSVLFGNIIIATLRADETKHTLMYSECSLSPQLAWMLRRYLFSSPPGETARA
jgi:hypothetical protein